MAMKYKCPCISTIKRWRIHRQSTSWIVQDFNHCLCHSYEDFDIIPQVHTIRVGNRESSLAQDDPSQWPSKDENKSLLRPQPEFCNMTVQFSRSVMSDYLWPHESLHARPPCPSPTPRVHSDSRPLIQWCHPAISSSVVPFSSCPQSLPASGSFQMSQLFAWGGQSTGVSASASFSPKKSQGWSPSEWTGWISLQSKGLSRVFSNTTLQKHQFFGAQLSS